jgi:hypothetical protein
MRGSCVCGAIEFTVEPPFAAFQYCHCSRCRKRTGSAHCANIFVTRTQLRWLKGEDHARRFDLSTAKYWSNAFCATCGSSVPWLSRTGERFVVPAGALDEDPGERPRRNVFWGSRAPWYVHAAELPQES